MGETTRYIRDEDGTVRQQIMENEKGELDRRIMMGPFGKTEEEFYQRGLLQGRNTYRYDQDGNLIEWLTYNAEGVQTASTTAAFDENGTVTEQFDRGPNNTSFSISPRALTRKPTFRLSLTSTKTGRRG